MHGLWTWDAHQSADQGEGLPEALQDVVDRVAERQTPVMPTLRVLIGDRAIFDEPFLQDPALDEVLPCNNDPDGLPICQLGNILPGSSKSYTVSVTVDAMATGQLINTATASASTDGPVSNDNTASEMTVVGLGTAELLILMDDTLDPLTAGVLLTYTVEVLNNGPDPAPAPFVNLGLPASVSSPVSIGCAEDPAGGGGCRSNAPMARLHPVTMCVNPPLGKILSWS